MSKTYEVVITAIVSVPEDVERESVENDLADALLATHVDDFQIDALLISQ